MPSSFPAEVVSGYCPENVVHYTPDSGGSFDRGALVYFDTATQTVKKCGADPALIAGIALAPSNTANISEQGKVPIYLLDQNTTVAMSSATTPANTHIGNNYGVVESGGVWKVDTSDTTNTRLVVVDIDSGNEIFYVRFLAANLQFDAVAS